MTGFLLAGVGDVDPRKNTNNFLIVDKNTQLTAIETAFKSFIARQDIAIILINQHV